MYRPKIHKFYYDILPTNKTMAVRSAKCHFVSEQQLISSITRNRYYCNYCKETWYVDASNIHSDSKFEMFTNCCFLHAWSLLQNDSIAVRPWDKSAQIACTTYFTSVSVDRLWRVTLIHDMHCIPYVIFQWIKIRWIWRILVLWN